MSDHNVATSPSQRGAAYVKAGTESALIVSGGEEPGTPDLQGRAGWQFIKPLADPVTDKKINLFYFGGTVDILPASHLSTMWSILTIDFFDGTSNGLPWLTYYTKPLGDGNDTELWYRTKVDHHIPLGRELVRGAERVCIWAGLTPPPAEMLNGARTLHLTPTRTGPVVAPTDEILYMTMHTDTSDTRANICVETLAYQTQHASPSGKMFNMHLLG